MICLLPKTAQQICGQTFFEQTWLCQPHSMLLDIPYTCFVRVRLCYKTEVLHQLFLLSHCYFGGDDAVLRRSLTLAVLGKCVVIDTTGVCVCVLFIRLCRTTIFFVVRFLQPQFRRRFFFNFFFYSGRANRSNTTSDTKANARGNVQFWKLPHLKCVDISCSFNAHHFHPLKQIISRKCATIIAQGE